VTAVAAAAGGEPARALALGMSMTALQTSIGALNDIHDAADDVGRKPGKPIPAALVSVTAAWGAVAGGALAGVALAALIDVRVGALAVVVLLIGYGYDLVAKGTAWSWLPFAVGIPLLPVFGWLGAAGALPPFFLALVPMAILAGAALAIANARADLERDNAAGTVSVATRLGLERSWWLHAALWLVTLSVGLGWLAFRGVGLLQVALVIAAAGLIGVAMAGSRHGRPAGRERAWQFEAVGGALALLAWLLAAVG
jgi:4-hydroxybenzoate polyprenyltransferase